MSIPNIPDITPKICIDREDAIALLLISIALEEISLADLISAETKKINYIVDECSHGEFSVQDLKDINRSINRTLKDAIKMQMLLQFKLENVLDADCKTTSSTCTTTKSTTTTTSTTTKTSTSSTSCPTTSKKKSKCGLRGRAQGFVSNPSDKYYFSTLVMQADICGRGSHIEEGNLFYSIHNKYGIEFTAFPGSMIIECPNEGCSEKIIIKGMGSLISKDCSVKETSEICSFVLSVWKSCKESSACVINMKISKNNSDEIIHDSGIVKIRNCELYIKSCC